ncbi:MAG: chromosome segregation protein [Paraglaciecola sp.]|jgi:chromosome segregation protein
MRLKKIKLAGFKSFVDPTSIPFPDEMTAIVGPNGCGKSNVIDAVRWVLGESSAKNLRGDAMTDVIFNGSIGRKAVSQCSVELVFDNSSGRIKGEYASYNELSVKRIVTRDAQSSYLLNNSKCRRRDVTDLFLGTGLGPRSYAIIEQGMISRLIESKPQDLRVFIEEAAGISKYKERRRETETRIRHTKENLERLEDVRGELGQQLEKLQRQATAAKRYRELKQKERTYKGQLAALRWLKHNEIIARLELTVAQKSADVEAYVALQRSEEKDMTEAKDQRQDLKQKLSDIQQAHFVLGTEITRLEQNQIHTKKRRQQIEQELTVQQSGIQDSEQHKQQTSNKIEQIQQQLVSAEPEQTMLQEQSEQAQHSLMECEDELARQQNVWRKQDLDYNQLKQQAQSCNGQIQSMMNMQMRTKQRISELQQEQQELGEDQRGIQIVQAKQNLEDCQTEFAKLSEIEKDALQIEQQGNALLRRTEQASLAGQGELQGIEGQISAMEALQNLTNVDFELTNYLQQQNITAQPWWQTLEIQSGWEHAFETVTDNWRDAQLIDERIDENSDVSQLVGAKLVFAKELCHEIPTDSLAAKLNAQSVPRWLSHICVADSLNTALKMLPELESYQSVITREGCWLGADWFISGCKEQDSGHFVRVNQLKHLNDELIAATNSSAHFVHELRQVEQQNSRNKEQLQATVNQLNHSQQQLNQAQNQLLLLEQQKQHSLGRKEKLQQELLRQQNTLADEQQQLEEFSMQAEELEIKLESLQEQQQQVDESRDKVNQKISDARMLVESFNNKLHQLALHLQGIRSELSSLLTSQQREVLQLQNLLDKRTVLQEEFAHLSLPLEEQSVHLEELLAQSAQTELQQAKINDLLADVESRLSAAEKGQQGVTEKIHQIQLELQNINLECEGYRVRAKGVLEQLDEMHQSLTPLLESLPDEANEQQWQKSLEKTSDSIVRLGAVNLAAVEEYDIQADRKQHLDVQNEDLVSALETLEQAIRKIDKETRSRFKQTFDQVNDGLKVLFPKVFGGGSAYLDLTDNDLLETGVTIMARPPGKKNSTIHLLSGGEKALTALSLVFAIFRLNPAPFCLLDEVDAPLDDANVVRFCNLVSEMSNSVQFIFITHNKIAMEMATHLTGVTMAEPGVSRMVTVDVDEAIAIAQA